MGLLQAEDPFAEALFITKETNRLVGGIDMLDAQETARKSKSGVRGFADIAVLYRTHRQADLLEYCFAKEGIPYTVAGRDDFLEAPQVRRVAAFFRFLLDPADVLSLRVCLLAADSHAGKRLEELTAALCRRREQSVRLGGYAGRLGGTGSGWRLPFAGPGAAEFPPLVRRGKPAELLEAWMRDNALEEDWELGACGTWPFSMRGCRNFWRPSPWAERRISCAGRGCIRRMPSPCPPSTAPRAWNSPWCFSAASRRERYR